MASTAKVDGIHMPFNWLSLLYYSRVTVNTPPIPRQSAHLICAPVAECWNFSCIWHASCLTALVTCMAYQRGIMFCCGRWSCLHHDQNNGCQHTPIPVARSSELHSGHRTCACLWYKLKDSHTSSGECQGTLDSLPPPSLGFTSRSIPCGGLRGNGFDLLHPNPLS